MTVAILLAAIKLYVSTCHPTLSVCQYVDEVSYFQCEAVLAQQRLDCKKADAALVTLAQAK